MWRERFGHNRHRTAVQRVRSSSRRTERFGYGPRGARVETKVLRRRIVSTSPCCGGCAKNALARYHSPLPLRR
jgi:hypothetical protein